MIIIINLDKYCRKNYLIKSKSPHQIYGLTNHEWFSLFNPFLFFIDLMRLNNERKYKIIIDLKRSLVWNNEMAFIQRS